jgi:uncharacterized phiE125 gp8 family phage protein
MGLSLVTAPAVEPVSLAEMKKHLGVDHSDDDAYIGTLITAARMTIDARDGWLGRTLVTQTWDFILDSFPAAEIAVPLRPVQAIASIKFDNPAGTEETVAPGNYYLDNVNYEAWIFTAGGFTWPATLAAVNAVTIRVIAGYGNASAVPAPIRAAIMLMAAEMYERREWQQGQAIEDNPTVYRLLHPYRVYVI